MRISWDLRNTSCITSVKTAEVCIPSGMRPGGEIIDSSSEPETAVTNGMRRIRKRWCICE